MLFEEIWMNELIYNIETADLSKSFFKRKVLEAVSLKCKPGKIYGIVGENGSGKSTLLNILTGFLKSDSGTIHITGKIGYCPQIPYIFDNLTVYENLKLFGNAYGLSSTTIEETGAELCELFQFTKYLKTRTSHLSSGTKQKLNLVISLLHNPEILFLDEPYAALDWETYLIFWNYAGQLKEKGKTIVIVSHLIYDRENLDEIKQLKNGVLI